MLTWYILLAFGDSAEVSLGKQTAQKQDEDLRTDAIQLRYKMHIYITTLASGSVRLSLGREQYTGTRCMDSDEGRKKHICLTISCYEFLNTS